MTRLPDLPLDGLYGDAIMDHYRNPRRRAAVAEPEVEAHELNPFCGDEVWLQLKRDARGRVVQMSASSVGCSIIQASTSMMADLMEEKTFEELEELAERFRDMMQGRPVPETAMKDMGELAALQVVRQYPVRVKCALLPWATLEEAIEEFRSRRDAGGR